MKNYFLYTKVVVLSSKTKGFSASHGNISDDSEASHKKNNLYSLVSEGK